MESTVNIGNLLGAIIDGKFFLYQSKLPHPVSPNIQLIPDSFGNLNTLNLVPGPSGVVPDFQTIASEAEKPRRRVAPANNPEERRSLCLKVANMNNPTPPSQIGDQGRKKKYKKKQPGLVGYHFELTKKRESRCRAFARYKTQLLDTAQALSKMTYPSPGWPSK